MEHQRRVPGREVSTNINAQPGDAHTWIRCPHGPVKRSTASRAKADRPAAAVAVDGAAVPFSVIEGIGGAAAAKAFRV